MHKEAQLPRGPHGSKLRAQWGVGCAMVHCQSQLVQETQMSLATFGCYRKSVSHKTLVIRNFPLDHTGANIAHSDTSVAQCCPADCNFPRYLNYFAYFRLLPKAGFVKNPADFTNFRLGCQLSVAPMVATEIFFVGQTGAKGSFR